MEDRAHRRLRWPAAATRQAGRLVPLAAVVLIMGLFSADFVADAEAQVSVSPASTQPETGLLITLPDALRMAKAFSPQLQQATSAALQAKEQVIQARAARLPTVTALNQFIYTEGNGTASGVFVANDGVHVYNEQAIVHQDFLALVRSGASRQAAAAEAVAKGQEEIARRGLVQTVVQDFYNQIATGRKVENAKISLDEAQTFVEVTKKQEQAGIVSHVDVVGAELQMEQRSRDLEDRKLAEEQARLTLAVLLMADPSHPFTVKEVADDLPAPASLSTVESDAKRGNPDILTAQAMVNQSRAAATVARYGYLPSLVANFYYGINANQLTDVSHNVVGTGQAQLPNTVVPVRQNLGYAADVTLNIPLWDWGATRSKVRAANEATQAAQVAASATTRQLNANTQSIYQQAEVARHQLASLEHSRELSEENLHLMLLRYKAGQASSLEVVTAESALAAARDAVEDGRSRYYLSLAQLQLLTGNL